MQLIMEKKVYFQLYLVNNLINHLMKDKMFKVN